MDMILGFAIVFGTTTKLRCCVAGIYGSTVLEFDIREGDSLYITNSLILSRQWLG